MSEPAYVVVLAGKAAGKIGCVRGRDYTNHARTLVHFPGEAFPNDFRSIRSDNLREADAGERVKAQMEFV